MIKLPHAGFMIDEYAPPDYTNSRSLAIDEDMGDHNFVALSLVKHHAALHMHHYRSKQLSKKP